MRGKQKSAIKKNMARERSKQDVQQFIHRLRILLYQQLVQLRRVRDESGSAQVTARSALAAELESLLQTFFGEIDWARSRGLISHQEFEDHRGHGDAVAERFGSLIA